MYIRLNKEYKKLVQLNLTPGNGVAFVDLVDGDLMHWRAIIDGPKGTPYQGGSFQIDIIAPADYPFRAPKMKFLTKVWHPNICSQTGAICLYQLKDGWSPALTIVAMLHKLTQRLTEMDAENPQDMTAANQFKKSKKQFDEQALEWTQKYAMQPTNTE